VVTRQLQVERRTGKVRRPETNDLPLCYATNPKKYRGMLFDDEVIVGIGWGVERKRGIRKKMFFSAGRAVLLV